jgi:hypothetical protein
MCWRTMLLGPMYFGPRSASALTGTDRHELFEWRRLEAERIEKVDHVRLLRRHDVKRLAACERMVLE